MPHALRGPMPNAPCPMPHALCPTHVGYLMLRSKGYNYQGLPIIVKAAQ